MASEDRRSHPPEAWLHAFVAGEVDPAQRAAISSHLEACTECRAMLQKVEAFRALVVENSPQGFDELTWRRVGQGVMAQLERDAHDAHRSHERFFRRVAVAGIAAAVAIIAGSAWIVSRPAPETREDAHELARAPVPPPAELPQGLHLELSEGGRMLTRSTDPSAIELELQLGELHAFWTEAPAAMPSLQVRTPDFIAVSRSTDFTIGYTADESFVSVRTGEVELLPDQRVIRPGETHRLAHRTPVETAQVARPKRIVPRSIEPEPEPDEPAPEIERAPIVEEQPQKSSSEGETSVDLIAPPQDRWAKKLRDADAAYSARRHQEAIMIAEEIVRTGGARREVALAKEMLCDLHIAAHQPDRAIAACSALLATATDEDARAIHYKLATIHRKEQRCRQAIAHYTRAILFGRASPFDDEAMTWRARCEIQLGDLAAAQSDIAALERRAAGLARPDELEELKRELARAMGH